jgi:UDP-GlcNAc:undecaprenyl-phosphate GlcNAc-1-phosphate transferase
MILLTYAVSAFVTFAVMQYFFPKIISLLNTKGNKVTNYAGRSVINSMGLAFLFPCLFGSIPFFFAFQHTDLLLFWIIVFALPLAGFIDDLIGDGSIRGIKRHFLELVIRGKLTTGSIKALIGVLVGFILSLLNKEGIGEALLNIILFILFINFINLLDLRPGRALKAFMLLSVLMMFFSKFNALWILLPLFLSIPVYFKGEMKEIYMLGDTGANLIGGVLGYYALKGLSTTPKLIITFFLIGIHIFAEFHSLTTYINSIRILRYLDQIGMLKNERKCEH